MTPQTSCCVGCKHAKHEAPEDETWPYGDSAWPFPPQLPRNPCSYWKGTNNEPCRQCKDCRENGYGSFGMPYQGGAAQPKAQPQPDDISIMVKPGREIVLAWLGGFGFGLLAMWALHC